MAESTTIVSFVVSTLHYRAGELVEAGGGRLKREEAMSPFEVRSSLIGPRNRIIDGSSMRKKESFIERASIDSSSEVTARVVKNRMNNGD